MSYTAEANDCATLDDLARMLNLPTESAHTLVAAATTGMMHELYRLTKEGLDHSDEYDCSVESLIRQINHNERLLRS